MKIEKERRWLVALDAIPVEVRSAPSEHITQGYLSLQGVVPVFRVRLIRATPESAPHRGVQTVKAPAAEGMSEVEFDLSVQDASDLMSLRLAGLSKVRHTQPFEGGLKLELDLFEGEYLEGLAIVEVELPSFDYPLSIPSWFGPEVTGVRELSNVSMAFSPILARGVAEEIWAAAKNSKNV